MAGPGRRLDSTDNHPAGSSKSTKSQSDVYIPPKRTELTSEARFSILIHNFYIYVCIFIPLLLLLLQDRS